MAEILKMDDWKKNFIRRAAVSANLAGHIFPIMAACEAALESRYGTSDLALMDNNLFGMKQHKHPVYGTHMLPTKEVIDGKWEAVNAGWVHYPSWRECFQDRMKTLLRLRTVYANYDAALQATDPASYVLTVSKTWATDPDRGKKVLDLYNLYFSQPEGVDMNLNSQETTS